jgi:hypothetical protein
MPHVEPVMPGYRIASSQSDDRLWRGIQCAAADRFSLPSLDRADSTGRPVKSADDDLMSIRALAMRCAC